MAYFMFCTDDMCRIVHFIEGAEKMVKLIEVIIFQYCIAVETIIILPRL